MAANKCSRSPDRHRPHPAGAAAVVAAARPSSRRRCSHAAVLETTVTLTATTDGTLNDAAAVAALAEELGVDAERITLFHSSSFDGTLEAGAAVEVKVVVAVEDASAVEAVEQKLGEIEGTDAFGASFEVTAVAARHAQRRGTRPASSSPPPAAPGCDCGDADASDDGCKATCDAIGAGRPPRRHRTDPCDRAADRRLLPPRAVHRRHRLLLLPRQREAARGDERRSYIRARAF